MPWVRFDDHFAIHRKVAGLSDAAFRLHVSAVFWCALNLTDGWVPEEDLDDVSARVRTPARFAAECVKRNVWHEARHDCGSATCAGPVDRDGWMVHDYLAYQPSREQVLADREKAAERQRKWREAKSGKSGRHAVTQPGMSDNDPIHNARSNGVTNRVSASSPPRPEGSGAAGRPGAPDGRASPPGPPPGGRQDGKSVADALSSGHGRARPLPPEEIARRARAAIDSLRRPP